MPSLDVFALGLNADDRGRPIVSFAGQHGEPGMRRRCRIVDGGPDQNTPHLVLEIPKLRDWRWRALAAVIGACLGFVPMPALFENGLGMTPYAVRDTNWETIIPALIMASTAAGAMAGWLLSRGRGYWLAGAVPMSSLVGFVVRDSVALSGNATASPVSGLSRVVRADFKDGHAPIEVLWTMAPAADAAELAELLTKAFVVADDESEAAGDSKPVAERFSPAPRVSDIPSIASRDDIPGRL